MNTKNKNRKKTNNMDTTELGAGFNPVPDEKEEVVIKGFITIMYPFEGIFPKDMPWEEKERELVDNPDNFINGRAIETKIEVVTVEKY